MSRRVVRERGTPGNESPLHVFAQWAAAGLAFTLAFAAYAVSLHPGLPSGDSGELITVAATGGVAHPPGYPLYTMLAGLFLRSLPLGEEAWRVNLISAIAMAMAAAVLALVVTRLSRSAFAGVAAALLFAFAGPVFKYALVAEVFALNALLASLVLLALTLEAGMAVVLLAFLGALALSHHHTLLLWAVPAFVERAIALGRRWDRPRAARTFAAAALGLLPLAWLPHAAAGNGLRWGEADTLRGFLALLLRAEYGTFRLDPSGAGRVLHGGHLADFAGSLPQSFGGLALAALLIGTIVLAVRHRRLALVVAVFAGLQAMFYTRIGFPMEPAIFRGVVERFAILPLLVLAAVAGVGLAWALGHIRPARMRVGVRAFLVLALLYGGAQRLRAESRRGDHFTETLASAVLASTPPGAVLFVQGDLFHNSLVYLQQVRHRRPDVLVLDQELMTYAWYVRRVRAEHPDVLPRFTLAERIRLTDGRLLEGLASAHGDSLTEVLFERGNATIPTGSIRSVDPAPVESLYAFSRAGYRTSPLLEVSDDRYSGLPASRNLRWIDHLAGRRPVAFLGVKEDSYSLRYQLQPQGLVSVPVPKGTPTDLAAAWLRALDVFEQCDLEVYFRGHDPLGFETAERGRFAEFAGRAALLMCQPGSAAIAAERPAARDRLLAFARRFETLDPTPDAYTLRAIGFLRAFDPTFRDVRQARADLERALAALPASPPDTEARLVLQRLQDGSLR